MPSPKVSNCGRPARPNICITSRGLSSVQAALTGLYTCRDFGVGGKRAWWVAGSVRLRPPIHACPASACVPPVQPSRHTAPAVRTAPHPLPSSPPTCVPLMMTVCAGRLTPQARVAVDTRICSGGTGGSAGVGISTSRESNRPHRHQSGLPQSSTTIGCAPPTHPPT